MKQVKDMFLMKLNFPAPAQPSSSPLLDRLLVFSLKAWVYTRGLRFFECLQIWCSSIVVETSIVLISGLLGGMARSTVSGLSIVVLLQAFFISLNNQLTPVGW